MHTLSGRVRYLECIFSKSIAPLCLRRCVHGTRLLTRNFVTVLVRCCLYGSEGSWNCRLSQNPCCSAGKSSYFLTMAGEIGRLLKKSRWTQSLGNSPKRSACAATRPIGALVVGEAMQPPLPCTHTLHLGNRINDLLMESHMVIARVVFIRLQASQRNLPPHGVESLSGGYEIHPFVWMLDMAIESNVWELSRGLRRRLSLTVALSKTSTPTRCDTFDSVSTSTAMGLPCRPSRRRRADTRTVAGATPLPLLGRKRLRL